MPTYNIYGPPDLCYLIKEKKVTGGFGSKTIRTGSFHYIYGFDTNSSATIAAYINYLAGLIEKKCKVIQGIYCCYDIVKKTDIRVEVSFPGSTNVYAFDE